MGLEDGSKKVLISIGDGPEGFEFYTSEEEAVCDFSNDVPALYLTASVNGAFIKLGPFQLKSIREELIKKLK